MLEHYLDFQIEVIERRTKFLLDKDMARDHIVIGLIKCHDNIDDIVDIIKASETPAEATERLMAKYGFTEIQVEAILAMNLRRLTGIENEKLEAERAQLERNIAEYNRIITDIISTGGMVKAYLAENKVLVNGELEDPDDCLMVNLIFNSFLYYINNNNKQCGLCG